MANFASISEFLLFGFAAIFALGIIAHWLAWKFKLPALLLLLIFGFIAGPVTGLLEPDVLLGDLLAPVITLSIGMMLFISGFELQLVEFQRYRNTLLRLLTISSGIALVLGAIAAKYTLGLPYSLATLISAICLLSGPSVVLPLLRETPLKGSLGSIVRWEGALLEVFGTVLALLVFEVTYGFTVSTSPIVALGNILLTTLIGGGIGLTMAGLIVLTARSVVFPDALKGGVSIGILLAGYALSFRFMPESGLLAALTAGIILGNQRFVTLQRYFEFGDTLKIPLYSALFVILASRVSVEGLSELSSGTISFNILLIFLVRPISVLLSTIGGELSLRERLFLSFFAPRGAIAAAVVSLFALDLLDVGFPQAERIVPIIFLSIIASVAVYGLGAPIISRLLEVSELIPRGVLILGAQDWAREIARVLIQSGFRVLIVDSNHYNVAAARREGLPARCENIFLDHTLDEVVLDGLKQFLALTSNNEVNALASLHFAELFGASEVYQLSSSEQPLQDIQSQEIQLKARQPIRTRKYQNQVLFEQDLTFDTLEKKFNEGWQIQTIPADDPAVSNLIASEDVLVLFIIQKNNQLLPITTENRTNLLGTRAIGAVAIALFSPRCLATRNNSGLGNSDRVVSFERPSKVFTN